MQRSKAASYLGFCRRAGKLVLGMNGVAATKSCCLLVGDSAAGKTSRERIERLAKNFSCPLVWMEHLSEAVGKEGCVVAAVRDRGFAKAIEDACSKDTDTDGTGGNENGKE